MREHSVNSLDNFICGWYMDDTSLCDRTVEYIKNNKIIWEPGKIGNRDGSRVDMQAKYSYDMVLDENPELMQEYMANLQNCLNLYFEKYPWCNKFSPFRNVEKINLQYYPPTGGYFVWHAERTVFQAPAIYRHLVFMTYLNDVTDEGGTEFFHQGVTVKPEKGLTLIWPSDWTHVHRGIPSETQEKYIATGWLSYYE